MFGNWIANSNMPIFSVTILWKNYFIDAPLMNKHNTIIKTIQKQEIQLIYHIHKIKTKQYRIPYFWIIITVDSVPQKCFMDSIFVLGNCSDNLKISSNIIDITFGIKRDTKRM